MSIEIKEKPKSIPKGLKVCLNCNSLFNPKEPREQFGEKVQAFGTDYCSALCSMASDIKKTKGIKIKTCAICGCEFRGNRARFCSEECSHTNIVRKNNLVNQERRKTPKERVKGKKISYEELNRRAEIKRLEEDWKRLVK